MLRRGSNGAAVEPAYTGPADLLAAGPLPGDDAVRYRGYVLPNSALTPVRSHGDQHHDSYNDYLWQLAMADAAKGDGAPRVTGKEHRGNASDERRDALNELTTSEATLHVVVDGSGNSVPGEMAGRADDRAPGSADGSADGGATDETGDGAHGGAGHSATNKAANPDGPGSPTSS